MIMRRHLFFLVALLLPMPILAQPARIVIVRHAEKANVYALCDMGTARAAALAGQYLGHAAAQSLFAAGDTPTAMMAITIHTIESITPAAQSWKMPVTAYTINSAKGGKDRAQEELENFQTQLAAHDVLNDPRYSGKTAVMMWEHDHIAKTELEARYPGEQVTLRQLLHLDQIVGVPEVWPDETYDYFWIVDFAPDNPVPVSFRMLRQVFVPPFADLPANGWGEPEPRHTAAGCLK